MASTMTEAMTMHYVPMTLKVPPLLALFLRRFEVKEVAQTNGAVKPLDESLPVRRVLPLCACGCGELATGQSKYHDPKRCGNRVNARNYRRRQAEKKAQQKGN
jgi:hypothetical protein